MNKIKREKIEKYSGKLRLLDGLVPHLKKNDVYVEKGQALTGDAPKVFLRHYEYGNGLKRNSKNWPAYIAKVGHKWYPVESIMEQFLTEIGMLYGLNIADSKIALASGQLRFMSKYFLNGEDQLTHGAQIYAAYLNADISFVQEIEDLRLSSDFFTIKFTYEALKFIFPEHHKDLFEQFLKMLTFDAITGNNDRHFYNWGVIENIKEKYPPTFSPIYDTARALFWNFSDDNIKRRFCTSAKMRKEQLINYCNNSKSKIGIEGENNLNHFELIEHAMRNYPDHRNSMIQVIKNAEMVQEKELLETTYCLLLTRQRRQLIEDCLNYRKNKLSEIAQNYD